MRRIKITLAYDGTQYHGWQVQPALTTIQGTLQDVLGEIEGRPGTAGPFSCLHSAMHTAVLYAAKP